MPKPLSLRNKVQSVSQSVNQSVSLSLSLVPILDVSDFCFIFPSFAEEDIATVYRAMRSLNKALQGLSACLSVCLSICLPIFPSV